MSQAYCPKNFLLAVSGDARLEQFEKGQKVVRLDRVSAAACQSSGQGGLYIIPRQFPFIIEVPSRDWLQRAGLAGLDERVKRLNCLSRSHIVRSIISKKIIEKNFGRKEGGPGDCARLTVRHRHLLTETVLSVLEFRFNFAVAAQGWKVGSIPVAAKSGAGSSGGFELDACCTLVTFELEYKERVKRLQAVLVMKKQAKPRPSDIYYCFSRFKNGVFIKLYVEPKRRSGFDDPLVYCVTKIQVQLRNQDSELIPCATSNQSFVFSARKSSKNHFSGNIRLNIASHAPVQLDSVRDSKAAEKEQDFAIRNSRFGQIILRSSMEHAIDKPQLPPSHVRHETTGRANTEHSRLSPSHLVKPPTTPQGSIPRTLTISEQQPFALKACGHRCNCCRPVANASLSYSRHTYQLVSSNTEPGPSNPGEFVEDCRRLQVGNHHVPIRNRKDEE